MNRPETLKIARAALLVGGASLFALGWMWIRLGTGVPKSPYITAILAGLAVVGAAYLLSVGAEVAQLHVPRAFAIAALALVAVLPEYAVDIYLAWRAGRDPAYTHLAAANMTGANRLLLGLFWPLVGFIYVRRARKQEVTLEPGFRLELSFLALATVYSFLLPFKRGIALYDTLVLGLIYLAYVWRAARARRVEVKLEGTPGVLAGLPGRARLAFVLLAFASAGGAILAASEPFAESLRQIGERLGVGEFVMIQWVAPLASEAPELVVAGIFAWKGLPEASLGSLVSSKLNQWTLLIGALPVAFNLSAGRLHPLPLDAVQVEEVFLTAAQSALGLVLISDLRLGVLEAGLLAFLFTSQFLMPVPQVRMVIAWVYIGLAVLTLFGVRDHRRGVGALARTLGRFGGEV